MMVCTTGHSQAEDFHRDKPHFKKTNFVQFKSSARIARQLLVFPSAAITKTSTRAETNPDFDLAAEFKGKSTLALPELLAVRFLTTCLLSSL